jgi:hypothetical protein
MGTVLHRPHIRFYNLVKTTEFMLWRSEFRVTHRLSSSRA